MPAIFNIEAGLERAEGNFASVVSVIAIAAGPYKSPAPQANENTRRWTREVRRGSLPVNPEDSHYPAQCQRIDPQSARCVTAGVGL
jgi:hypothetical protein